MAKYRIIRVYEGGFGKPSEEVIEFDASTDEVARERLTKEQESSDRFNHIEVISYCSIKGLFRIDNPTIPETITRLV